MKIIFSIILILSFALIVQSCKSEDNNPVQPPAKTYDVTYRLSGTISEINKIRYLSADGDTLQANKKVPVWTYQWTKKGTAGQNTFVEVVLLGQSGELYLEILANTVSLVNDTVPGVPSGQISYSRGITLPY